MTTRQKWLALLLALVLTLGTLAGCADDPEQGSAPSTETTMEGTGTEPGPPTEPTLLQTVPEYTGTPLIQPDPDREVYISMADHQDCDFYPDTVISGAYLYIVSKKMYNESEIGISIDMQTPYKVTVWSQTDECHQKMADDTAGDFFCNYHYLSMQGADWQELGQLALDDRNSSIAREQYLAQEQHSTLDPEFQALQEISQRYQETMEGYQRQFEAVPLEEIPSFYIYHVSIDFEGLIGAYGATKETYDETVEELELRLGDQRIPVRFGQWRFHAQAPEELTASSPGIQNLMIGLLNTRENPYHAGFFRVNSALEFRAAKDITITGVRTLGADIPMVGALVRMGEQVDKDTISFSGVNDFYWDLKMPIDVPAGPVVSVDLYLRDERFAQYETCSTLYVVMEYEMEGRACTMTVPCYLRRINRIWDTYLMAFEGIDLGEYYTCFYNPQYADYVWRMPEEWKK